MYELLSHPLRVRVLYGIMMRGGLRRTTGLYAIISLLLLVGGS